MKISKILLSVIIILGLLYIGYQYYQYTSLQNFIKDYKKSLNEVAIRNAIGNDYSMYGVVYPQNKTQLDSVFKRLKLETGQDKLYLEKYGYNIQVDTLKTDSLKYEYIMYKLYSYGPNKKDDNLKSTPFNDNPIEYAALMDKGGLTIKKVSFWKYLFMNKDFDIVLALEESFFNCDLKKDHYTQENKANDKAFAIGKIRIQNTPYNKYNTSNNDFNQVLQTIQENLSEQYPNTPIEGLIFNYNGKRVQSICSFSLPNAPIITIEKILTEKLNSAAKSIKMTTFYMDVPVSP